MLGNMSVASPPASPESSSTVAHVEAIGIVVAEVTASLSAISALTMTVCALLLQGRTGPPRPTLHIIAMLGLTDAANAIAMLLPSLLNRIPQLAQAQSRVLEYHRARLLRGRGAPCLGLPGGAGAAF